MLTEQQRAAYLRQVRAVIARSGWAVQGVIAGDRPYLYTVGLTRINRPELHLDLDPEHTLPTLRADDVSERVQRGHAILNALARQAARRPLVPQHSYHPGEPELLVAVVAVAAPDPSRFAVANAVYRGTWRMYDVVATAASPRDGGL